MKTAVVSDFGKCFSQFLTDELQHLEPFEVLKEQNGECDCGYEPLDPDSYHLSGCSSLYSTVRLPDGREQTVSRNDITIL